MIIGKVISLLNDINNSLTPYIYIHIYICLCVCIYIYIYIYEVHGISFKTFFVWTLLLIVYT